MFVTSHMTEGGAQKSMTSMSAMAKLTIKMLVTLCIDLVVVTAMITWKYVAFIFFCFKRKAMHVLVVHEVIGLL